MSARDLLDGLSGGARAGLIGGVAVILLATFVGGWWLLRTDYQPLFTDLKAQDAQAMTTELERLKIPYRLAQGGTSILVDKETLHATRIKLMGRDLPLHGAVGLELFNNTDFGMTEFAQKINYQRALQGELTRTIQSLAQVSDVRVLLALPEQGLFKQATSKAKASITVALRPGQALRAEQVKGIQRLVAAAVPGMTTQDVTIVDNQGVALTRSGTADDDGGMNAARLDLKRDIEGYLARKVSAILDRAFGPGQALTTVDVTLDMDQIRTTTEDVLPAASRGGLQASGVMVRERETLHDGPAPVDARVRDTGAGRGGSAQRDVEYAVGRRVEQVVGQPGSVRRLQVVAVVRDALDASRQAHFEKIVAAAVGAMPDRGDVVVVQSLAGGARTSAHASTSSGPDAALANPEMVPLRERAAPGLASGISVPVIGEMAPGRLLPAAVLVVMLLCLLAYRVGGKRTLARRGRSARSLSTAERAEALRRVRCWLAEDGSVR